MIEAFLFAGGAIAAGAGLAFVTSIPDLLHYRKRKKIEEEAVRQGKIEALTNITGKDYRNLTGSLSLTSSECDAGSLSFARENNNLNRISFTDYLDKRYSAFKKKLFKENIYL